MENKKYNLVFDIDQVVCDVISAMNELVLKKFGIILTEKDWKHYEITKNEKLSEEAEQAIFQALKEDGFNEKLVPLPGAIKGINKLSKTSKIYFVSSRYKGVEEATIRWFKKMGIGFDSVVCGVHDKGIAVAELDPLAFVDDHFLHLEKAYEKIVQGNLKTKLFLNDKPWNQLGKDPLWITRVNDWQGENSIIEHIEALIS